MSVSRPITPGGGVITAADGESTAVDVSHATAFWVISTEPAFIVVSGDDTPLDPMDETNATFIAADTLYGPFQLMRGVDKFIHVGGNGAAASVTITLA
jgi:hypothetical protein